MQRLHTSSAHYLVVKMNVQYSTKVLLDLYWTDKIMRGMSRHCRAAHWRHHPDSRRVMQRDTSTDWRGSLGVTLQGSDAEHGGAADRSVVCRGFTVMVVTSAAPRGT